MKTKLSGLILILAISAGLSTSKAQEMVPAIKNLQKFVGNWNCADTKAVMGGKAYTLNYDVKCSPAIDGMGVYIEEYFKHDELGTLKGLDIVGYDPNLKLVHMYTIDNMGTDRMNFNLVGEYNGVVQEEMSGVFKKK
jgi:hypothetical protein